jgi:hypothetical protein
MTQSDRRSVGAMSWRRRVLAGAAIAIVAALGVGLGVLLNGSPTQSDTQALEVAGSSAGAGNALSQCESHAARRLQLYVVEISCADALRTVPGFSAHVGISSRGDTPSLFQDHGWTCWAKLEPAGSGGAVQNFCLQGGRTIVYLKHL